MSEPTARGAADFFSLVDAGDDTIEFAESSFDAGEADELGFAPRPVRNTPRPTLGALSKEQLNVEEPVGLASMRPQLPEES